MKKNNELIDMYPGSVTMNEWVFSQTGPILLNVLAQILEKYPDIDISEMMIIARAIVADRKADGCPGETGNC